MLLKALVAADAAIAQNPASAAAHANRAETLIKLGLFDAAMRAFATSAGFETDPRRAAEAQTQRAALDRQSRKVEWARAEGRLRAAAARLDASDVAALVQSYPQEARVHAEGPYMTEWANAYRNGDGATANDALRLVRSIGESLERLHGDRFVVDAVRSIDGSGPSQRLTIASAQMGYDAGRRAISGREVTRAIPLLHEASVRFATAGSPMALVAGQFHAAATHDANNPARAGLLLAEVSAQVPDHYRARRAEIAWLKGTILGASGAFYSSLESYRQAEDLFSSLGEAGFATLMTDLRAHMLTRLGRDGEAITARLLAFRHASEAGDLEALESMLTQAASDASHAGLWEVAASFYRLALDSGAHSRNLRRRSYNLLGAALAASYAGDLDAASTYLQRATISAQSLNDSGLKESALNDVKSVQAILLRGTDPRRAYDLLTQAIAFARTSRGIHLSRLLLERARTARVCDGHAAAIPDLKEAVAAIEQHRAEIGSAPLRDTFLGSVLDAYDELIDVADAARDYELAFATAERKRGRFLIDHVSDVLTQQAISNEVPAATTLLHFTSLPDRILIFAVNSKEVHRAQVAISKPRLTEEIENFRRNLQRANPETLHPSDTLHDVLLAPLASTMVGTENLVIIPDETIALVPFAALAMADRTFAGERWSITIAPSATAWAASHRRFNDLPPPSGRALVLGDPAFDATRYRELPRLPGAANEARRVAALYNTDALTGAEATRARLAQPGGPLDTIHIAAHAISNAFQPDRSSILLADGELTIADLLRFTEAPAPVVILAGCRTGSRARRNDLSSFANAFIATGARSVVATLWDLPDGEAGKFAIRLHQHLVRGERPARALAEAQRDSIRDGLSPSIWAAFQVYGSPY